MASWDQLIDQILLAYRCCPHTSTGESPFFLVYNRDPTLQIHQLNKTTESCKGDKRYWQKNRAVTHCTFHSS